MNKEIREKIIVSADDFGISREANEKILELVKLGKIDRVAVLPKGILEKVDELIASGIKLDIHFNITEKFNGPRKLKEGTIRRVALFLVKYAGGQISASKVKKEWEEQIQKFKEAIGKYPDGINSHQHVHYYPSYFKVALELAEKYSIPFIRFGEKGFLGKPNGVKQILTVLRKTDLKNFQKNKIETTDYLVSFDWIKNFDKFLSQLSGSVEITFHPERKEEFEIIKKYF